MTRADIHNLFREASDLDDRIRVKECEIENMKALAQSAKTIQITGMPKATGYLYSPVERDTCNFVEEERKLEIEKQKLLLKKQMIFQLLASVRNPRYRKVLMYRYLEGHSWKEVADLMECSQVNAFYLHRKALESIKADDEE